MPIFSYFLVVGSVLTGLLYYADKIIGPAPQPVAVSQRLGLPEPFKPPVVMVDAREPAVIPVAVEAPVEAKKPVKVVRKRKPTQVVRQVVRQAGPQQRYAAYPLREHGSLW